MSFASRKRAGKPTHFRRRRNVATIGVKEFAVNLERHRLSDYLVERPDIRLVTLVRSNPLARLVSARRLAKTGEIARTGGDRPTGAVSLTLDPATLEADLAVLEAENDAVRRAGDRHQGPVFNVEYEAFFDGAPARQEATIAELLLFLGVAPAVLESEHKRLRQGGLADAVSNFEEVRKMLKGGRFERWLDEPAGAGAALSERP